MKIRNLALVDELSWELGAGLIGVTGETGAGKSVIVGALKLILGERGDKSLIRSGQDSCVVEAVFETTGRDSLSSMLEEGGIAAADEESLIIRRVLSHSGNRQFVNDSPVTQSLLKKIGEELVDLHGPHDHQSLLSTDRQRAMLDAYADNRREWEEYQNQYRVWRDLSRQLDELQQEETTSGHELELLTHVVNEIDQANLQVDEEKELEDRWRRATNASKLRDACGLAMKRLNDEEGVLEQLGSLQKLVRDLERIDPNLGDWSGIVERSVIELEELASSFHQYARELDLDEEEIARVEERMNTVEILRRKYGSTFADILERREQAAGRLDLLQNRDSRIEQCRREVETARAALRDLATALTRSRRRAAPRLAKEIASQLKDLGFQQSVFEIRLQPLDGLSPQGAESIDYFFGPNPGEPVLPLRQIASSGEISRVMLAVKSALAEQDATPLMVFDEIDANVGGEIASAVGSKMATLGERHQVVAITHFPQVAAKARHHFVVEKKVVDGRTTSRLRPVEGNARVEELMRMLGGGGDKARSMAASLLER